MKKSIFLFLLSGVFLAGCSSVHVVLDYDRAAEFEHLKTYAWQHATQPKSGNPRIDNDLIDVRIRNAVNTTLATKGFRQAPRAEADFLVAYFVEYKRRIGGSAVSFGLGAGSFSRFGGVGYSTDISDYEEGVLMIDIIDARNDKVVWRGTGTRVVYEGSDPDKVSKIVNEAVSKILAKFPPGK